MTITKQARAAAEAIAEYNGSYSELRHTPESVISAYERIITKHVHPPSPTEAIEAALQIAVFDRTGAQVQKDIITALESLQGKAGVNEWGDPEAIVCVACGKPLWAHSCDRPPLGRKFIAAATPASGEKK